MRSDQFEHGVWIKGRIYEEKCDVSPDGKLFLSFVHQGSRWGTKFTDSWTAISRVPWLKALAVWPQGTTYGGGGRFIDNRTIELRGYFDPPCEHNCVDGIRIIDGESPTHSSTNDVPDSDWCGRDHYDRIIFTRAGHLYRHVNEKDTLVADFTDLIPNPQPAPDWAARPL